MPDKQIGTLEKAKLLYFHLIGRHFPWNKRGFDAAKISRLLNDWVTASKSLDYDIKSGLTVIRARSRDLCMNNDYGKKFMNMLAANVVGPNGIGMQAKVKKAGNGKEALDSSANKKIETAWQQWCRKENCTVNRKLNFADVQRLAVQGAARDGEFIIRKVNGFDNDFKFALQIIEPDYLDHNYSDDRLNIKMGVELNRWKEPVAYHILKKHPGEDITVIVNQARQRVLAEQIIHEFIIDRGDQTRGYPWTVTAMRRLYMLGHYEESELVSARVGAAKMGFFTNAGGATYSYDDKDAKGNLINEVSPGKFEQLPVGYDFKPFDIDHPNAGFDAFVKAILKGAASGLGVSYASLSNDLKDVNYSSIRHGTLEERDAWMLLQNWLIEHLCRPVFEAWLPQAIASGRLALPMRDIERWNMSRWQPRRWSWVDPYKDVQANAAAIEKGLRSRSDIIAEQGGDLDDVFEQLAAEDEKAKELKLNIQGSKNAAAQQS